jgi:excisionase family DNA binding protein
MDTVTDSAPLVDVHELRVDALVPARMAYSPREAASLLGLARSSIYGAIARGELRSVQLGSRRLIPASEIDRVLTPDGDSGAV